MSLFHLLSLILFYFIFINWLLAMRLFAFLYIRIYTILQYIFFGPSGVQYFNGFSIYIFISARKNSQQKQDKIVSKLVCHRLTAKN